MFVREEDEIKTILLVPYQYRDISSSYFRKTLQNEGRIIEEVPDSVKRAFKSPQYYWRFLKEKITKIKTFDTKIIGLTGTAGSGKTTILDILIGKRNVYYIKVGAIEKRLVNEKAEEIIKTLGENILDNYPCVKSRRLS